MNRMFVSLLALLFSLSSPVMKGNAEIWRPTFAAEGTAFRAINPAYAESTAQSGTYAFPRATFNSIGQNPAALKNCGDLPGAVPQYFRVLQPPAGTPIQRGIVPGGQFGGAGGVPEVIFPRGFQP